MEPTEIIHNEAFQWLRYLLNSDTEIPPVPDWKVVLEFAEKQALTGIFLHDSWSDILPEDEYYEWIGVILQIEQNNIILNKHIESLFSTLARDGFRCCLLKGQGNAAMYPDPLKRSSGDIDVWVDSDKDTIYKYVKKLFPSEKESFKHIHFPLFEDVNVDLHFTPIKIYHPIYNRRFQKWICSQKEEQMSHFAKLSNVNISIAVPTAAFNAVYQLGHIMIHIEDEGIGLRQFVDYFYVLKQLGTGNSEVKESIRRTWKRLGMFKLAGAVMWIEKYLLGLSDEYLIVSPDEKKGLLLAEDILEGGNFGHSSRRQEFRKYGKISKKMADLWHLICLSSCFPGDAFFRVCFKVKTFFSKYIFSLLLFVSVVILPSCSCGLVKHVDMKAEDEVILNKEEMMNDNDDCKDFYTVAPPKVIQNESNLTKGKKRVVLFGSSVSDKLYNGRQILCQEEIAKTKTVYVIQKDFDLMGETITIPEGCVLSFEKGSICNGTIVGNSTAILYRGAIFDNIKIEGTWNVPEIRSSMFVDSNEKTNRLKDVIALTSPYVENTVYIEEGHYSLKVAKVTEHLLPLKSHTTIVLDGIISVEGNSYPRYRIFSIKDVDNITIKGHGAIIGDRYSHNFIPDAPEPESKRGFNTTHENGHGIEISDSRNIDISGITIKNCIGDGICIDGTDVSCRNLTVTYCRRQGISVVDGERINISHCDISHIWDSRKAGFGIDIEPHSGNSASYVAISDCNIFSCNGGINFQCHTFESVKHIRVSNCNLSVFGQDNNKGEGREQYRALMCFGARDVRISHCSVEDISTLVYVEDAVDFSLMHSKLVTNGSRYGIVLRKLRGIVTIHDNKIRMYDKNSMKKGYGIAIANLHNAVLTKNEILSESLSASGDTDCNNVVMVNNIIKATWDQEMNMYDCRIEGNTFTKKVSLRHVEKSSIKKNKMPALKVKDNVDCDILLNKVAK